jgi:tetratricopeptide (TPR) repeat protein
VIIVPGGLFLVGMTFLLISGLHRGDYTPVIGLVFAIAFVTFTVLRGRRKALALFREATPDRAIAFYHSSLKRAPNGKPLAAHSSAFAAVLYGEFDRAREELSSINWAALLPVYQGFETHIHSLLAIFEAKDYLKALQLAEEARDLTEASEKLPGVATSRAAHDANVAVCELLTGKRNPELLSRLDKACKDLPGVSPAIPSWALATYYAKAGESDAAERYSSIVRRLLPHSILLRDLDKAA